MPPEAVHLYFIRHGETVSNSIGILHGITDVPLNVTGMSQAERLAYRVRTEFALSTLYSSPLRRARSTAAAITAQTGHRPRIHRSFTEMGFGEAEGIQFDDVERLYPRESVRFLDPYDLDVRFPGGETRREFFRRVEHAISELRLRHSGEHVGIVAHGGVIAAAVRLLHQDPGSELEHAHIKNCSITHIELDAGGVVMHRYNDTAHLDVQRSTVGDGDPV